MNDGVILVIGDVHEWLARGRNLPADDVLEFCDYAEFNAKFLKALRPDVILSPLMGQNFDALDVAMKLEAARFCGCFRILAPKLPHPEVVETELRSLAPSVDCELVQVTKPPELKLV